MPVEKTVQELMLENQPYPGHILILDGTLSHETRGQPHTSDALLANAKLIIVIHEDNTHTVIKSRATWNQRPLPDATVFKHSG